MLRSYVSCRQRGLSEPEDRAIYDAVSSMTLADVTATQERWAKGRDYTYAILGKASDLDVDFLSTLGPVEQVSLEEIFGY